MNINWNEALRDVMPEVIEWRRWLHRHPEVSGQEAGTREYLESRLTEMDIPFTCVSDCYGLVATLDNGGGACVAIRADMDALPVTEATGLSFASEHPGVMHACGHDTHMAMALGSARWFSTHRDSWKGTIKWLFEPQEETVGGGKHMVEEGCMEHPTVDCVIGQHVNPSLPVGTFFSRPGSVSGSSDELYLTVHGKGCHGAYPHAGVDAIVITAQIISALQSLVSRTISPFTPAVITFGTIQGGRANNVVADEVRLTGTLRTLTVETRKELQDKMKKLCCSIAEGMGGTAELTIRPSYGAVTNDAHYYAIVEKAAREICPEVITREAPSLGVESFCYFEDHTPGVYYDLGSGVSTALHSSTMVIDEGVLETGIAMQCAAVLGILEEKE